MECSPQEGLNESLLSRRKLLFGATALAAVAASVEAAHAGPPTDAPADVDPSSLLVKLIRRTTYGFNQAEHTRAQQLGYHGYLEEQLNYTAIDDSACNQMLAQFVTLNVTPAQINTLTPYVLGVELQEAKIYRAIYSRRQLYERMVEFWTDHFNIDIGKSWCAYLKCLDDRDVIRANALGNFGTMLRASAHSPAMMEYLDNRYSTAAAPNENYARELMELHTMGVDGGYTQADVREVARCFTGWGFDDPYFAANPAAFRFTPEQHDNGPKTLFFGTSRQVNIAAGGGQTDGDRVLTALINHPSTARFIAKKLCRFLLSEDPSQALISAVATTYTSTGGDIKSMVRQILQPAQVAAAPPKYKRPLHFIASCLRAVPTELPTAFSVRLTIRDCGHGIFEHTTPDGYPDTAAYWGGFILPRWNFAFLVAGAHYGGVVMDVYTFFDSAPQPPDFIADRINQRIFGSELLPAERAMYRDYIIFDGNLDVAQMKDAVGLALSSPTFQWY